MRRAPRRRRRVPKGAIIASTTDVLRSTDALGEAALLDDNASSMADALERLQVCDCFPVWLCADGSTKPLIAACQWNLRHVARFPEAMRRRLATSSPAKPSGSNIDLLDLRNIGDEDGYFANSIDWLGQAKRRRR